MPVEAFITPHPTTGDVCDQLGLGRDRWRAVRRHIVTWVHRWRSADAKTLAARTAQLDGELRAALELGLEWDVDLVLAEAVTVGALWRSRLNHPTPWFGAAASVAIWAQVLGGVR